MGCGKGSEALRRYTVRKFSLSTEAINLFIYLLFVKLSDNGFSGSLLIQQITGNAGPPPLINHVNNSLLISAESAARQSVINSQPQYANSNAAATYSTNASYLINAHHISSANSTVIDQIQSSPCLISATSQQSNNFRQYSTAAATTAAAAVNGSSVRSETVNIAGSIGSSTYQMNKLHLQTNVKPDNNEEVIIVYAYTSFTLM